jgi:hypothetical protein
LSSNLDTLTSNTENFRDKARLLATQQKESGAWLNCLPSSSLGTLLDDSSFRIAVALRTGQHVCEPHTCICGDPADKFGHHGLSCRKKKNFFTLLGKKISSMSNGNKSTLYLTQRISLAIQRGNAASVPQSPDLEEIF